MSNTRFFNGGRDLYKRGIASEQMRFELQKKGKMPAGDRYRRIMKKKLEENKQKAMNGKNAFGTPFNLQSVRKMSKHTERVLKEMAQRKAAKEAKALRQMVIVQPRVFPNGTLNKKGQIFDIAGNMVAKVNVKNGKIVTNTGWDIGKYKPQSYFNGLMIQEAITKHSPFFIQQRKLAMMAHQGVETINVHGSVAQAMHAAAHHDGAQDMMDSGAGVSMGPRQNIGMTSWGARSDNVWGTYADNAWGQSADTVWGTNSTDVWGGIGVGGLWGGKGQHIWGTGNGANYLKGLTSRVAAFFGLKTGAVHENLRNLRAASEHMQRAGSSGRGATEHAQRSSGSSGSTRTAAPAPRSGK